MEVAKIKLKDDWVFYFFLSIRLLSVLLVQTFYVPDEYWQSLEVAHRLTFGYGYLTWEWSQGIRSYLYPLIISVFYKIAQLLGIDYAEVLIYMPRILQAGLSAYADLCFYRWTFRSKWAIFLISTAFFWYYTATRTLLNTFEAALTIIALSKYPWIGRGHYNCKTFTLLVALNCVIRPTAAICWVPMCVFHLLTSKEHISALIIRNYLPIGFIILLLSILVDTLCHGSFLISSYEFFKMNLIEAVGDHYGSQPWHWYLSQGLPTILGINFLTFVLACLDILRHRKNSLNELILLVCVIFTIFTYSFISHKEFRFVMPLLPIILHISANYLSKWSINAKSIYIWIFSSVILIANVIPAWYIGLVHQRGTLDIMQPLREIAITNPNETNYLFLMPCHSTPLYSYLHVNVSTRFLTCEPNFNKMVNYTDEADKFYKAPNVWLRQNILNGTLPTHLILFDSLETKIQDIINRYKPLHRIFHTSFPTSRIGRYVMIYQRVDLI